MSRSSPVGVHFTQDAARATNRNLEPMMTRIARVAKPYVAKRVAVPLRMSLAGR